MHVHAHAIISLRRLLHDFLLHAFHLHAFQLGFHRLHAFQLGFHRLRQLGFHRLAAEIIPDATHLEKWKRKSWENRDGGG